MQIVNAQKKVARMQGRQWKDDMVQVGPPMRVRVEITEETLSRLLADGQVCAADFNCLDCKSKQCLWRLCLKSCNIRR